MFRFARSCAHTDTPGIRNGLQLSPIVIFSHHSFGAVPRNRLLLFAKQIFKVCGEARGKTGPVHRGLLGQSNGEGALWFQPPRLWSRHVGYLECMNKRNLLGRKQHKLTWTRSLTSLTFSSLPSNCSVHSSKRSSSSLPAKASLHASITPLTLETKLALSGYAGSSSPHNICHSTSQDTEYPTISASFLKVF